MVFKALFGMSDKMGPFGFLVMWFSFFFTTFGVLLADSSVGAPRNFCFASQLVCCTNLISVAYAITNELDFTKVSMLTTPLDMFVTWLAFAYFGGSAVLSSTPIGVFNWIQVVMMGMMGLQMMFSLLAMAWDPAGYKKYLNDKKPVNENP